MSGTTEGEKKAAETRKENSNEKQNKNASSGSGSSSKDSNQGRGSNLSTEDRRKGGQHSHGGTSNKKE